MQGVLLMTRVELSIMLVNFFPRYLISFSGCKMWANHIPPPSSVTLHSARDECWNVVGLWIEHRCTRSETQNDMSRLFLSNKRHEWKGTCFESLWCSVWCKFARSPPSLQNSPVCYWSIQIALPRVAMVTVPSWANAFTCQYKPCRFSPT